MDDLGKQYRAPLLYHAKLCALFQSHEIIQTEVRVRKHSIRVKIRHFLSRVTSNFDGWPLKATGRLFYATSSFVHHFVVTGEFKLELQSGNAQFGSKSTIFLAAWPWNLTDDLEKQYCTSPEQHQALCIISSSYVNSNCSYGTKTAKLGFDLCDLDLWPWPFAWTSLLSLVITSKTFMMTWCWEYSQKGVTDRRTEPFIKLFGRS